MIIFLFFLVMEKNLKDDVNIKFGNDVVKLDVNISILFRLEGKLD